MPDEPRTDRFALRRDRTGWTVFEVWTGEPEVIAMIPQDGLSEEDARHTAELLNQRARSGDRSVRQ